MRIPSATSTGCARAAARSTSPSRPTGGFAGTSSTTRGKITFFGIIYPDNQTFTWVNPKSKGYNHGRIMGPDRIAACYVEAGEQATAGCSDLKRVSDKP
jgi:hypothetical protein